MNTSEVLAVADSSYEAGVITDTETNPCTGTEATESFWACLSERLAPFA